MNFRNLCLAYLPLSESLMHSDQRKHHVEELKLANAAYRFHRGHRPEGFAIKPDTESLRLIGVRDEAKRACSQDDFDALDRYFKSEDNSELEEMIADLMLCPFAEATYRSHENGSSQWWWTHH